ncbi:MAG: hypothetical protein ACREUT_10020 [Steroidobacteraceae bacterium]
MNANRTAVSSTAEKAATYGGLLDAVGGIASAVLAVIGLTGFDPEGMAAIATIVFGVALLIQGGTILSEYLNFVSPPTAASRAFLDSLGGEGVSAMFVIGIGGIVLGVLALLGVSPAGLTAIGVIAFGSALLLGGGVVRQLDVLRERAQHDEARSGNGLLAGQIAAGSTGVHVLSGVAGVVLGILAIAGHNPTILTLAALLLLGLTALLTGGTLVRIVMSFMWPAEPQDGRPNRVSF